VPGYHRTVPPRTFRNPKPRTKIRTFDLSPTEGPAGSLKQAVPACFRDAAANNQTTLRGAVKIGDRSNGPKIRSKQPLHRTKDDDEYDWDDAEQDILFILSRRDKADRSLARSAWERAPPKNPSRRVRYDQAQLIREVFLVVMDRFLEPARYRHVVPYGTAFFGGGAVQGTSCQATVRTVPPGHLATGFRAGPAKIRNLRPRTDHGAVPSRPG
jgi:hypothetical protein